jgi:hypothetical protein
MRAQPVRAIAPILTFGVIALVYLFFATGGRWHFSAYAEDYYSLLGDAFVSGQLSLKVEPAAELLALENPYDPRQNEPYRLHDASLYDGRYYLYWGPFPGLVHAGWQAVRGHQINVGALQTGVLLVACFAFYRIVSSIARDHLRAVPMSTVIVLTVNFALSGTMLYLVGRPSHYNEAPSFGVASLVLSWLMLLLSQRGQAIRPATLLLSGTFVGLAIASRSALLFYAVGPLLFLGLDLIVPGSKRRTEALVSAALYATPIVVVGLLLLAYNSARFGSASEFGMSHVLQGSARYYDMNSRPDHLLGSFFRPGNLPNGLALYLLSVPVFLRTGPYIDVEAVAYFPPGVLRLLPANYVEAYTPLASLFLLAPVVLFAGALLSRRFWASVEQPRPVVAVVLSSLLGAVLTLMVLCMGTGVTARYPADMLPGFTVAGAVGFLLLVSWARTHQGRGGGASALRSVTPSLVAFVNVMTVPVIVLGLIFGLMAWLHAFPAEAAEIYDVTDELLAQLTTLVRSA